MKTKVEPKDQKLVNLTVRMPASLHRKVRAKAAAKEESMQEYITRCLNENLSRV